jgi:hypothetical protein
METSPGLVARVGIDAEAGSVIVIERRVIKA